jgi:hypothetical protein
VRKLPDTQKKFPKNMTLSALRKQETRTDGRKNMSTKEKEVQKRYQQEMSRYKKQVEKIKKLLKKKVA